MQKKFIFNIVLLKIAGASAVDNDPLPPATVSVKYS